MRLSLSTLLYISAAAVHAQGLTENELFKLRSIGDVALSPDGAMVAYTVNHNDGPGRPYAQLHVLNLKSGVTVDFSKGQERSSNPLWSRDSKWLAYEGTVGGRKGLIVSRPDNSEARFLAPLDSTNHPLTETGARVSWAPDSKRLAFVTTEPGPETAEANGDPIVITRYLYKPDFAEGNTRFNDNKRTHIFLADRESGAVKQLTRGNFYEHSIDWSPLSDEILFVSHREVVEDVYFNNDLFSVNEEGLLGFAARSGPGETSDRHRREHRVNRAVN